MAALGLYKQLEVDLGKRKIRVNWSYFWGRGLTFEEISCVLDVL